ncbi:GNAT family N-acetyltransferase [Thalassobacillus devorans]|uniref:GNAT family N-acetyltransferase n=1 Tax=Thalassobacillus devorans TaxID=279813 RepID=UPI00048F0031|nr:GNAT family N-acetyltransferase [Thalassobacillus devorans]
MKIRHIEIADAERFRNLMLQVEAESDFMLYEAGERDISIERQKSMIKSIQAQENAAIFLADFDGDLAGYLIAVGGKAKRTKHSAYLVIGINADFRGNGIGSKLFQALEAWAQEKGIHRLELTVVTQNEAALGLYKKAGFEVEGTKRDSLLIDGDYVNEYYMAKLL